MSTYKLSCHLPNSTSW